MQTVEAAGSGSVGDVHGLLATGAWGGGIGRSAARRARQQGASAQEICVTVALAGGIAVDMPGMDMPPG
jgi:hypothetical protein